ncbi:MAG: cell division protein FtsZ [Candidatus Bathyarchaeota archaeon]
MVVIEEKYSNIDQERIEEVARLSKPQVAVVGLGGAGCNIVSWIKQRGMVGGRLLALNTDANHLAICKADRRILIGEKITKGLGCGGYPEKGEAALKESFDELSKEIKGASIVFVVAGLGGGTGTGASAALCEELKGKGPLIVGVVTVPFAIERVRMETARKGIERLKKACDTVVTIDNNKLVRVAGDLPFAEALGVANELVGVFVKDITETVTTASLINLDYMDLRAIMEKQGIAAIGAGWGQGDDRVEKAVKIALEGQLLDILDVTKAHGVLVHVSGGDDLTLEEVYRSGELVTRAVSPKAKIIWGARVNPETHGDAHVFVCLTGVESAFLSSQTPRRRFGIF